MSIAQTYSTLILEQIIHQILDDGIPLSVSEIDARYKAFVADQDLSKPLFNKNNSEIVLQESASVTKYNQTNFEIARDLTVLYQELFTITDDSIKSFDRWRTEILSMQSQINALDTRITDLLRTQIDQNAHFIADNFADATKIDLNLTDAFVNLNEHTISLSTSNRNPTRLVLNNIDPSNVQFTVLSRNNLQTVVNVAQAVNAFDDKNNFWQTQVIVSDSRNPITGELKVKLNNSVVSISKIIFTIHSSNSGSPMQITPLISVDGVNYSPLNTDNTTLSVDTKGVWSFPSTDAFAVKFIITKTGYDVQQDNNFIYEFGAQDISFYNENFQSDLSQTMFSNVLNAIDNDNNPIEFDSVSLEVCERTPTNTTIDYFISALSLPTDNPTWIPIDKIDKDIAIHSKEINFGNISNLAIAGLKVSYDSSGSVNLVNPGSKFNLITLSSGITITTPQETSNTRYVMVNSNERILDSEIDGSIDILQGSIQIFRNVGIKGNTELVRTIQRGWTYLEPYYISNIEITNQNGLLMDFGDQSVVLDNTIVKGRITITNGIHNIKVHKNNWVNIVSDILSIDDLKIKDPLFPFNHKYLVEGYPIVIEGNPYQGADIFAGYFMTEVSAYELFNNVSIDDYSKFATDMDADVPEISKPPSTVFVVKSNENYSDFLDELFTIRFSVKHQLYKYLKFKAELVTQDSNVTPNLDGYKLKISI